MFSKAIRSLLCISCAVGIMVLVPNVGQADLIYSNVGLNGNYVWYNPAGWSIDQSHWVAVQFTLDQEYIISDIYGYIRPYGAYAGNKMRITVYGSELFTSTLKRPDMDNVYLTQQFIVENLINNDGSINTSDRWDGLSGLDLYLTAGEYWAGFEVNSSYQDAFMGSLTGTTYTSNRYATLDSRYRDFYAPLTYPQKQGGFKVYGSSPVPEPATMLLFGSGLVGLAGFRRKFRKN